jgi:hypothetical protein
MADLLLSSILSASHDHESKERKDVMALYLYPKKDGKRSLLRPKPALQRGTFSEVTP